VVSCEDAKVKPTADSALQFAIMLRAGLPAQDAILYFADGVNDAAELSYMLQDWQKSPLVKKAMLTLMGKAWQDMSLDEQCKTALDQHYAGLAYFLFSHNYSEVGPSDQTKLNTARTALEARAAGTAGKGDALSIFFDDLRAGRVKLGEKAAKLQGVPFVTGNQTVGTS
jgi:hypothetical protein